MHTESKFGKIILNTKVNGLTIRQTAKDSCGAQMVTSMRVIGKTTKLMVLENSLATKAESNTLALGWMTYIMARASKAGLMAPDMMEISPKERKMDLVRTCGLMGRFTLETGSTTRCAGVALTNGSTVASMKATG